MNTLLQFDICFARLPLREGSHIQGGCRPVVVISNNIANKYSPIVSIVPLTSKLKKRPLPTHVTLFAEGLACASTALCEQMTTIDKSQLIRRIGTVSAPKDRAALNRALAVQFGMMAA